MLLPLLALMQIATATKQSPAAAAAIFNGRENQLQVHAPRVDAQVKVDGLLDEPVWAQATVLAGFSQYSPVDGRASEDSTRVLVWYGTDAMYLGIKAYEAHGSVNSALADRDHITGDDYVQIFLDTFNDHRRAFVFGVNPLGIQADGILNEGTQTRSTGGFAAAPTTRDTVDLSVDFVYQSKGHVTPAGYEVEMRIPFKSLRYQADKTQDWGINVVRRVQHSGADDTWTPARRANASFLAQAGKLVGLSGMSRGLVLDLNPVTTAKVNGAPSLQVGGPYAYDGSRPQLGGNARWGITNNLTANGTINPDFSQVEADVQQVTIDPRSAISFPEKRPFFLEGAEQFEVPNSLIYTRRLVQPAGAVKLNGKAAGMGVGLLSGVDDQAQSLTGDHPIYNILRLKKDVGKQSSVGLLYTDKLDGNYYNHVGGVDGRIIFAKLYTFGFQGVESLTGGTTPRSNGGLWDTYIDRNGRKFGLRYSFTGIQPDFVTAAGFIRRGNNVHINLNHRYTWFGKKGNFVESFSHQVAPDALWYFNDFPNGEATELKFHNTSSVTLRGGWRVGGGMYLESFRYPNDLFKNYAYAKPVAGGGTQYVPFAQSAVHAITNWDWVVSFNTPQFSTFSASGNIAFGPDENFYEWSQSFTILPTINFDWRPNQKVRLNGRYVYQEFRRASDGSTVAKRSVPRLKLEYQLSRPIFFRVVGQYDSQYTDNLRDDDGTNYTIVIKNSKGVYLPVTSTHSNNFRMDYLFSYQPTPGTVIFAGYGSSLAEDRPYSFSDMRRASDGFFVKLSYLFRMK